MAHGFRCAFFTLFFKPFVFTGIVPNPPAGWRNNGRRKRTD